MLGREDKPAITRAFNVTATPSKECGKVQVASFSWTVDFGLDATDEADPPRVSHDEKSLARYRSPRGRRSIPLPSTPVPQGVYLRKAECHCFTDATSQPLTKGVVLSHSPDNDRSVAKQQSVISPTSEEEVFVANYRVRIFDGRSRKEISKQSASSTKKAVEECIRIARERPGDYALAQSTRQDPGGVFAEAYLVRYMTPADLVAAKAAGAVESDVDLLVSVMGLIPGPWSGPGSL
jgi:hypothetical protein